MNPRLIATILALLALAPSLQADDWPQWMGPKRDSVWRETGILATFPKDGPSVKWRAPISGGFAGPAVAEGRVYVTDYVTDGNTKGNPAAKPKLKGKERVLCFNASDGKPIWTHEYDCPYEVSYPAGPRCTPTVSGGKVYTLGSMGNLFCLDAVTGKVLWEKDFKKDFGAVTAIWGFSSHPLVDGNKVFCVTGGKDALVTAFDKDTGKVIWSGLNAKDTGYSPPTMIEAGGKKQLLICCGDSINSIDPETGKPYWTFPLTTYAGMAIMAPRKEGDYLFFCSLSNQALVIKLASDKPAAEVVTKGNANTFVYCVNSTPFVEDGIVYGVDVRGELRAAKLLTGERLWETYKATTGARFANSATAFLVKNGDRFFIFSETGELIIAKLSAKGYEEISRAKIIQPATPVWERDVVWTHPAFANKCVYVRNDKEIVCVSLEATN